MQTQINNLHKNKRVEEVEDESLQENSGTRERERRKNAKRMRRTAEEIERKYYCSAQHCDRCYGS